ncbi:MAG TPA: flagellar hook-basal body protein [Chthoniobacterales bacterium]|jgi:flagellar basal body rod protein FlgG|nr:flagellar hook-basal body protein [Chthoniobacterales bacterium]
MNIGLYKGAAALGAYEKWQEVLSQNLASASVPGFKKSEISFDAVSDDGLKVNARNRAGDGSHAVMPKAAATINFAQGELRRTGVDLDFAIQGDGFFQIQRANGELGYTRNGQFQLKPDRTLVTNQGLTVMGESGPITFPEGAGPISINPEGMVFRGDEQVAKLAIYQFKDQQKLHRIGDGLMAPSKNGEQPAPIEQPAILNGHLEQSNVSPLIEMVNLIEVSRAYEAAQKVIQSHDEESDKAIQTLGSPT